MRKWGGYGERIQEGWATFWRFVEEKKTEKWCDECKSMGVRRNFLNMINALRIDSLQK